MRLLYVCSFALALRGGFGHPGHKGLLPSICPLGREHPRHSWAFGDGDGTLPLQVHTLRFDASEGDAAKWQKHGIGADDHIIANLTVSSTTLDNTTKENHFNLAYVKIVGAGSLALAKKSYSLDFTHFHEGQRFHGQKKLGMRANANDCTGMREPLATAIYAAACAHTYQLALSKVYVNGVYLGVYALAEWMELAFLKQQFQDVPLAEVNNGTLWLGGLGSGLAYTSSNWEDYRDGCFTEKESSVDNCNWKHWDRGDWKIQGGDGKITNGHCCRKQSALTPAVKPSGLTDQGAYTDLMILVNALNQNDTTVLEDVFDVESMLRQMAVDYLIGHWDGYWRGVNNYFLFQWWPQKALEEGRTGLPRFAMIQIDFDLALAENDDFGWTDYGFSPPRDPARYCCLPWAEEAWPEQSAAPLATKLLANPVLKQRFDLILKELNDQLFYPDGPVSKAMQLFEDMLREPRAEELALQTDASQKQCQTGKTWDESVARVKELVSERSASAGRYLAGNPDSPDGPKGALWHMVVWGGVIISVLGICALIGNQVMTRRAPDARGAPFVDADPEGLELQ